MKYIGPYLRINSLNLETVHNELFHFAKESLKHITLNSGCGITTSVKDFKITPSPNIDINIYKEISPLLCIYKKASGQVLKDKFGLYWEEDSMKKDIEIESNAFLTLSLLHLSDYYYMLETLDKKLYTLGVLYSNLAKEQLDFYSTYLRNDDGIFVDKKNLSQNIASNIILEAKEKKYDVSNQGLIMAANYKYSLDPNVKDSADYKNFAMDILNMLIHYREELYSISFDDRCKLIFSLNLFYEYSKNDTAKELLMDLMDYQFETFFESDRVSKNSIDEICLNLINLHLYKKNLGLDTFEKEKDILIDRLLCLYNSSLGIFVKPSDKKRCLYTPTDIILYILTLMIYNRDDSALITDVYKKMIINSGLVASWPDAPTLEEVERYKYFSLKSEDLLSDENFKPTSIPTPDITGFAPIFSKKIEFSSKKKTFNEVKKGFDSSENIFNAFLIIYLLKSPLYS